VSVGGRSSSSSSSSSAYALEGEALLHHLVGRDLAAVVVERQAAAQQNERDDPEGPNVDGLVVRLPLQHLRGDVPAGAKERPGHGPVGEHFRKPEIDYFHFGVGPCVRQKEVLRLEVPVDDALLVHVVHGGRDLRQDTRRFGLRERTLVDDVIE